jgi:hypothetical protein
LGIADPAQLLTAPLEALISKMSQYDPLQRQPLSFVDQGRVLLDEMRTTNILENEFILLSDGEAENGEDVTMEDREDEEEHIIYEN